MRKLIKLFARLLRRKRPAESIPTAGRRVYHEYFVPAEVAPGALWPWLARVYLADGSTREHSGSEATRGKAVRAALHWAEDTKKSEATKWH
jgi:hypothetical protein